MKYNHRDHRGANPISRNEPAEGALRLIRKRAVALDAVETKKANGVRGDGRADKPAERYPRNTYGGGRRATRATDRKSTDCADANAAVDWGC